MLSIEHRCCILFLTICHLESYQIVELGFVGEIEGKEGNISSKVERKVALMISMTQLCKPLIFIFCCWGKC